MKKSFIICVLATIMGLGAVSCSNKSNEDKIKEFAVGFADKASKNQIDSLKLIYPGIENADSVALKYVAEGIVVNLSDNGNEYEIILSPDVTIWVSEIEDQNYTVTESKGLFAYPEEKKDFATKTGLWEESLNDTELAKRMNDEEFLDYVTKNKLVKFDKIITVGNFNKTGDDSGYYILKNTSSVPINGSDYEIIIHSSKPYYDPEMPNAVAGWTNEQTKEPGLDLPANGEARFTSPTVSTWVMGYIGPEKEIKKIEWKLSNDELQKRFVSYTGNEYQEYLDSKTKESK